MALGDHRVGAVGLQPQAFCHGGGRAQHHRPPAFDPREQWRRRQPEVKTHHRRFEFGQQFGRRLVKRRAAWAGWDAAGIDAELGMKRRQRCAPHGLTRRVGRRRRVAKEVDVEGLRGARTQGQQFAAQGIGAEHGARQ
jgi:hypothetical protein